MAERAWQPAVVLAFDSVPASMNTSNHPRSHHRFLREKAQWERVFYALLVRSGLPRGIGYVHADALLQFPQRRRRDEGNFKVVLEKALGDALQLTDRPWLADDTAAFYHFGYVAVDAEPGPKLTRVRLAWTY